MLAEHPVAVAALMRMVVARIDTERNEAAAKDATNDAEYDTEDEC